MRFTPTRHSAIVHLASSSHPIQPSDPVLSFRGNNTEHFGECYSIEPGGQPSGCIFPWFKTNRGVNHAVISDALVSLPKSEKARTGYLHTVLMWMDSNNRVPGDHLINDQLTFLVQHKETKIV